MAHKSSTPVRYEFENEVRKKLPQLLGLSFQLEIGNVTLSDGTKFVFDLYNKDNNFCGEVYATAGKLNSGRIRKVSSDILKLALIENLSCKHITKYIVFSNEEVRKQFQTDSWVSRAIKAFKIETFVVPFDEERIKREIMDNAAANHQKISINPTSSNKDDL